MAIGAVASHRNFGNFIGSGQVYHGEACKHHRRGEYLHMASVRHTNRKMFCYNINQPSTPSSIGCSYQVSYHATQQTDGKFTRSFSTSRHKVDPLFIMYNQMCKKFKPVATRNKTRGMYQNCLCSSYSDGSSIPYGELGKLGFIGSQKSATKHSTVTRTRAEFKSEEHDATGSELQSLMSSHGAGEAALIEGLELEKPWWEQFPKRWVMVLLCFAAFLLCNMDRVNMSIAILPMSKEFNWNSATVGLIQSSFFWGYLMTQVVHMFQSNIAPLSGLSHFQLIRIFG